MKSPAVFEMVQHSMRTDLMAVHLAWNAMVVPDLAERGVDLLKLEVDLIRPFGIASRRQAGVIEVVECLGLLACDYPE